MKNKILILLTFFWIFLLIPSNVMAHPGRTDSNGCHYCRTNCAKWGLTNNQYHCHNGGSTSSKKKSSSSTNIVISKSSDNTLKSVFIDGKNISINDIMNYSTKKEKINIKIKLNDNKANYVITNNDNLKIGTNNIIIKVTAENGNVKKYSLLVEREKLSNNTNIKIIVDGNNVNFVSEKANVSVSNDVDYLSYEYELEDKKAKVDVIGDDVLKIGDNNIIFVVTAEDGTRKEYKLTVNKSSKSDEITSTILGLIIIVGFGYGIYYFVNRSRNK